MSPNDSFGRVACKANSTAAKEQQLRFRRKALRAATARPNARGAKKVRVEGNPDPKHVSTSYAERSNLTIRMHMRRFTRLTNAFSKKVENHAYAVALHMMYDNFVRIHQKLRVTPAMAAGVSVKLWEIGDIVKLIEDAEGPAKKRGHYHKVCKT